MSLFRYAVTWLFLVNKDIHNWFIKRLFPRIFAPYKFTGSTVRAEMFGARKLESLGYRMTLFAWFHVQPFWYSAGLWRTDGRTDRHMMTIYTLYRASIASRGKKQLPPATTVGLGEENPITVVLLLPPGLPPRTVAWTVSSELLCFWFYFSLFCRFWAVR